MIRIGHGYDVHRFSAEGEGNRICLGGVEIPFNRNLVAHSDGDVLLHAICDALLGALALGDIGKHFPDTDEAYKNADSKELLKRVASLVSGSGYKINNIDSTIIAQVPRMAPYIERMQMTVSGVLGLRPDQVSIKATTTEKLGAMGRSEGIACQAVVLVENT